MKTKIESVDPCKIYVVYILQVSVCFGQLLVAMNGSPGRVNIIWVIVNNNIMCDKG